MGKRDRLRKERILAGIEKPISPPKEAKLEAPDDLSEALRILSQVGAIGQGLPPSPKMRFQFTTKKRGR